MSKRILDLNTISSASDDDYLVVDGSSGTRKITPENIVGNSAVAQTLANNISNASDDIEEMRSTIGSLQSAVENIPIVDPTLSQSGQAADAKETGDKINDVEISAFSSPISYSRIASTDMWTSGQGVTENTGANFSDPKYSRSAYIQYSAPTILYINSADYEFNCWAYFSNSASSATFAPKKDYNKNLVIISTKNSSTYFRIGVRRADGTNISATDITALTTAVKTFTMTDTTLEFAGVPADAKAVKDKALLFKGVLANNTDLNSVVTSGIYYVGSSYSYQHAPASSGFLIVMRQDTVVEQIFCRFRSVNGVPSDKFTLYKRDGNSSGVSQAWANSERVFSRTIAFFGDSIMWGRDGNSLSSERTVYQIPDIVADSLSVNTINYGVGGQGYMPRNDIPPAYDNISSQDLSGVDAVVMCYGVNDGYVALGDWDSTDENTVMGQFNKIINYIYTEYPGMQVIVFAPFNGTNVGTYPDYWYGPRNHQDGYPSRKIMSDTLKQACDYYWIPYIEQYDSPLNAKTITYYLPDGVHPSDDGYKLIGEWFAAKLRGLM